MDHYQLQLSIRRIQISHPIMKVIDNKWKWSIVRVDIDLNDYFLGQLFICLSVLISIAVASYVPNYQSENQQARGDGYDNYVSYSLRLRYQY